MSGNRRVYRAIRKALPPISRRSRRKFRPNANLFNYNDHRGRYGKNSQNSHKWVINLK